jgi:folate-binding protein YgfZ
MTTAEKLEAARRGSAVGPVEARGVLRFAGKDALAFLHRMSTQDLARLRPGDSAYAAFLEAKGHVVSDAVVQAREGEVLLLSQRGAAAELRGHLARFVLRDDVRIEDRSAELACLPVLGEEGVARARREGGALAVEDPRRGAPAVDLLLPEAEAARAREALLASGAADLSAGDLEALRILAGIPRFGVDLDRSRLVIEAGVTGSAISFEKGCYIGQEVVLRGTFRGQVQKGLVQLELPPGAGAGAALAAGGQEVGAVTSAADTPEGRLGLGILRRAQWKPGTRLAAAGGEAVVRRALVEERD